MLAIILSLLVLFVLISFLIVQHLRRREAERGYLILRRRVTRLRFAKMLSYLGADLDEYIHEVPQDKINAYLKSCESCKNLDRCDACLRDGRMIHDMSFCCNYHGLIDDSKCFKP